jgi:hypothetical protein
VGIEKRFCTTWPVPSIKSERNGLQEQGFRWAPFRIVQSPISFSITNGLAKGEPVSLERVEVVLQTVMDVERATFLDDALLYQ